MYKDWLWINTNILLLLCVLALIKQNSPPSVFQIFVDGLARIMCMSEAMELEAAPRQERHQLAETSAISPHRKHHNKEKKKIKCPELKYNKFQPPVLDYRDGTPSRSQPVADRSPLHNQAIESDIKEIKRILRTYINRLNEKDAQGKLAKEWRIVARVLDRLFFFMYVSTIIVSLATIFPKGWRHLDQWPLQISTRHFDSSQFVIFAIASIIALHTFFSTSFAVSFFSIFSPVT